LTLKLKVAGLGSVPAGPTASTEKVCLPFFILKAFGEAQEANAALSSLQRKVAPA
jgi:hypothetical protein